VCYLRLLTLCCLLGPGTATAQDAPQSAAPAEASSVLEEGRRLYFEGNYAGARAAGAPLAEAGNARALYNMATLYRRGLGVDRDRARAQELLAQSAEQGFAEAQYLLADTIMRNRDSDEADKQQAARWWLSAARQGHALSQYRLGLLYWNGEAVARDLVRGHAWMRLSSAGGLEDADKALETMQQYLTADQLEASASLTEELRDEQPAKVVKAQRPARREIEPAPAQTPPESEQAETEDAPARRPPGQSAEPTSPPSLSFSQGWRLQLAALRDSSTAEALWQRLSREAPDLVTDTEYRIQATDLGERGTFYRLRIGPFASREAATRRCRALDAAGFGCFPVSPDP